MFATQKDLFRYVWDTRHHKSEIDGTFIQEPNVFCFAHVLGKWQYPRWKFEPNNIILVSSIAQHREVDRVASKHKYLIEMELKKWKRITYRFLQSLHNDARAYYREFKV